MLRRITKSLLVLILLVVFSPSLYLKAANNPLLKQYWSDGSEGIDLLKSGKYEEAATKFSKCALGALIEKDYKSAANCKILHCDTYSKLNNIDKYISCLEDTIPFLIQTQNTDSLLTVYFELATYYIRSRNRDMGKMYSMEALSIASEKQDNKSIIKAYLALGDASSIDKDYSLVISYYLKSLRLAEKIKNPNAIYFSRAKIAWAYIMRKDYDNAWKYLDGLEDKVPQLTNHITTGRVSMTLGIYYRQTNNYDKALRFYKLGLDGYEKANDFNKVADISTSIAILLSDMNIIEESIPYYKKSLSLYKAINEESQYKATIALLGYSYFSIGDDDKVISTLSEYMDLIKDSKKNNLYFELAYLLSLSYYNIGNKKEANKYSNIVVKSYNIDGEWTVSINALAVIGIRQLELFKYREAESTFKLALKLSNKFNAENPYEQLRALYSAFSSVYKFQYRHSDAADVLIKALSDVRIHGKDKAVIYKELGDLYFDSIKYDRAIIYYTHSANTYKDMEELDDWIKMLTTIGRVYHWIGHDQKAIQYFKNALDTSKTTNSIIRGTLLHDLGKSQAEANNWKEGYINVRDAISLQEKIKDYDGLGKSYQTWGYFYILNGVPKEAIKYISFALRIHSHKKYSNPKEAALDYYYAGWAYMNLKKYDKAEISLKSALELAEGINSPLRYWPIFRLGMLYRTKGELDKAILQLNKAIEIFENTRDEVLSEDIQSRFSDFSNDLYDAAVRALMEANEKEPRKEYSSDAYKLIQRFKAYNFVNRLRDRRVISEDVEDGLVKTMNAVNRRISVVHNKLGKAKSQIEKKGLLIKLAHLKRKKESIVLELETSNLKYEHHANENSYRIEEIVKTLDDKSIILDYFLSYPKSYLWVIDKNGLRTYQLPEAQKIVKLSFEFVETIKSPIVGKDELNKHKEAAKTLYSTLLGPVEQEIVDKKRLIIIPHGVLYYLPFESLIKNDDEGYILNKYIISYAQSSNLIPEILKKDNKPFVPKSVLAVGDPSYRESSVRLVEGVIPKEKSAIVRSYNWDRLIYSYKEVMNIQDQVKISGGKVNVFTRKAASETNIKAIDLSKYDTLHFAVHGILPGEIRWISQPALILAREESKSDEDGYLQMDEIMSLKLKAELVVLSACNTALGEYLEGEGIIGLTRAFMYAGTPSVVVSLWPVNDQSTSILMERFYFHLTNGKAKGESLRLAKLDLIKSLKSNGDDKISVYPSSPYFWAPFVLVGAWN